MTVNEQNSISNESQFLENDVFHVLHYSQTIMREFTGRYLTEAYLMSPDFNQEALLEEFKKNVTDKIIKKHRETFQKGK